MLTTGLGLWYRVGHGLTVDEPFMANTVRLPWRDLWRMFPEDNLPFAYAALKGWTAIFGETEFALRSLSALAYGGAAFFTGLAAGRVSGAAGISAAVLVMVSDRIGLEHAATVRPYALLALATGAALFQSVELVGSPHADPKSRWRRGAALTVTHLIGLFTHPTYVVVATACACAALLAERRSRSLALLSAVVALAIYAITWSPVIVATISLRTTSWMRPPHAADVQRAFMLLWGVGPGFMIVGGFVVLMLLSVRRTIAVLNDRVIQWVVCAAVLGWILPIVISMRQPILEATRTPVMLLPLTCAAVAALVSRLGGAAPALAIAAVCLVAAANRISTMPRQDPYPTRDSLAALLPRVDCDDTLLAPALARHPVEYYLRRLEAPPCVRVVSFPAVFIDWVGHLSDPSRRRKLEDEASQLAGELAVRGGSVWLLSLSRGETHEATDMIDAALRREMTCSPREALKGAFFDAVARCDATPPHQPAAYPIALPTR